MAQPRGGSGPSLGRHARCQPRHSGQGCCLSGSFPCTGGLINRHVSRVAAESECEDRERPPARYTHALPRGRKRMATPAARRWERTRPVSRGARAPRRVASEHLRAGQTGGAGHVLGPGTGKTATAKSNGLPASLEQKVLRGVRVTPGGSPRTMSHSRPRHALTHSKGLSPSSAAASLDLCRIYLVNLDFLW